MNRFAVTTVCVWQQHKKGACEGESEWWRERLTDRWMGGM